jgi:hypothetical protein
MPKSVTVTVGAAPTTRCHGMNWAHGAGGPVKDTVSTARPPAVAEDTGGAGGGSSDSNKFGLPDAVPPRRRWSRPWGERIAGKPGRRAGTGASPVTVLSLSKRLDRLGSGVSDCVSVAETLERLRGRADERQRAWQAAGNAGMPPPESPSPLEPLPPNSIRTETALWRRLARGRARVADARCGRVAVSRFP